MPNTKKSETGIQPNENELQLQSTTAAENGETIPPAPTQETEKPKRTSRKKKAEAEPANGAENTAAEKAAKVADSPLAQVVDKPHKADNSTFLQSKSVLTIDAYADVQTQKDVDDAIWHEIQNAYYRKRILTGILGGIEKMENGADIAVVHYKGFRIAIPLKEMSVPTATDQRNFDEYLVNHQKLLNKMLGSEIDFLVCGIDAKSRSIVGSRKEAMLKKRQTFYYDPDENGKPLIYEGRVVQARIISVTEKAIHVEIFGVETSIFVRDLAWHWIGDAREHYAIGDTILLQVLSVTRKKLEDITVTADAKSLHPNLSSENLLKCRIQSKYAGKVTDIRRGVIFIRLSNGVNAVAHTCYDHRMPGKKDDVIFVVTRLDRERRVAVGIVTRIIRQNL